SVQAQGGRRERVGYRRILRVDWRGASRAVNQARAYRAGWRRAGPLETRVQLFRVPRGPGRLRRSPLRELSMCLVWLGRRRQNGGGRSPWGYPKLLRNGRKPA